MFAFLHRRKIACRMAPSCKPRLEVLEDRSVPATLGWAVGGNGEVGTILHTADGGANWSVQYQMPGIGYLRGVAFADTQNGWAVGGNGTILHTSDGGANWSQQTIIGIARYYINAVTVLDAQNAWAAGYGPSMPGFGYGPGIGTVYHTTNGGTTWYAQDIGMDVYHGNGALGDIDFADALHGTATGHSAFGGNEKWRTADGGATWTSFTVPSGALGPVDFLDAQHGWGAGSGILFSGDAGSTWSQINPSGFGLSDLEFTDSLNGWGVANNGVAVHTSDGGANWSVQSTPSGRLSSVAATDALNCWASGAWGAIVHSDNGGATWTSQRGAGDYDGGFGWYDIAVVNDTIAATIDVKPGNASNPINVASAGVIPVALFGTDSFDVTRVDLTTVRFAGALVFTSTLQDVNGDGRVDLMLQFRTQDTNLRSVYTGLLAAADTTIDGVLDPGVSRQQQFRATLTGKLLNGQSFVGSDTVDLFLSGLELRQLLDEMAADGLI